MSFSPGNTGNPQTITVGASAVPAHLKHGDPIGPCTAKDLERAKTNPSGNSSNPQNTTDPPSTPNGNNNNQGSNGR
ncbi:MAG: hypothetical protein MUE33_01035 [Cytophagaceae bacterium]|nr:hypothetical protein [Cytophagaceae bacterium]